MIGPAMTAASAFAFSVDAVVEALTTVAGTAHKGTVPLHEPSFGASEKALVLDCLDSGWVSSVGQYVNRFETDVAACVGTRHAIATVNGTAALHIALILAGVQRDDEVLAPALTFVATANAIAYAGAVPHFVESEAVSLGMDAQALADHLAHVAEVRDGQCRNRLTGRIIRAMVPMHVFGHPSDLDALAEVARRYSIALVEDAAEALGSTYKGRGCGSLGCVAALSFNGNKIITTGGGGMILTNEDALAARARHLTTTAKRPHSWAFEHDMVGYNYRLPNLNAALGCAQMETLAARVEAKRVVAARYVEAFAAVPGVQVLTEPAGTRSNYWLNAIVLDRAVADRRDDVLAATNQRGYLTRPLWTPMHRLPMYADCPRMPLNVAEDLFRRVINLPSSAHLLQRQDGAASS